MNNTVFVTGGAGFIGSALIRHIIANTTYTVINIDKLTYASNLAALTTVEQHPRYVFTQTDITDRLALDGLFQQYHPCGVIHLAAESHVDRSIDGPAAFIKTNIEGTYQLLEASRHYYLSLTAHEKSQFKFHHISTDEVYGDLHSVARDNLSGARNDVSCARDNLSSTHTSTDQAYHHLPTSELFFTEQSPYHPSSPYSASKAASDHLVQAWYRTYGLPVVMSHSSNNYGPYQHHEKLIPLMISHCLKGKELPIYGDGQQIRDWIYVEDHVRALWTIFTQAPVGENYLIGANNEQKNLDLVKKICQLLDELYPCAHNANTQGLSSYMELIRFVKDRPGHDIRYATDASKLRQQLHWTPQESFTTGLQKTVQWYLAQLKN